VKGKSGISPTISTIILFAVMFALVFSATAVANDAVNAQVESAEFEQAKNVILSLDRLVKSIMYKPDSSGYVKTSFWTVLPNLAASGQTFTLTVGDNTNPNLLTLTIPANVIKIKGASRATAGSDTNLVGEGKLLLTDVSDSLGRARVYQSSGAWTSLDYLRASCIDTGTVDYYNPTLSAYETYRVIEITMVQLTFASVDFREQALFIMKNRGLTQSQVVISPGSAFHVTVTNSGPDGGSDTRTYFSQYKTLVNLVVVNVEASVQGGS